jgi:hypothetical protein
MGMDTAQRLSRGFHRLALFLAAISLLAGGIASVHFASLATSNAKRWHDKQVALVCAQDAFYRKFYADYMSREEFDRKIAAKLAPIQAGEVKVTDPDLKELGCSDLPRTVSVLEIFRARAPGEFSWAWSISSDPAIGLGVYACRLACRLWRSPRDRLGYSRVRGVVIGRPQIDTNARGF